MTGHYLFALAVTIAVETPVIALFFLKDWRRMAIACAVATTATHLAMHFAVPPIAGSYLASLVAGEIAATAAEGIVYAILSRNAPRAFVASAVANSLSFAIGLL
jgi:hypothetical protein